jgi:hypothetical protein
VVSGLACLFDLTMARTPNQTLRELSQLTLSPLKLDSSLSSISSGHNTPPNGPIVVQNMSQSTFTMSAATTSVRPIPQSTQGINGRPNSQTIPQKRPPANLFIPKKRPRPNVSASQPHSANNTPKIAPKGLPNASQTNSTANSSQSIAKSPNSSMETKPSQPPKGINQTPVPIDAPYRDFDLLTGDMNGPTAPGGFYPQVGAALCSPSRLHHPDPFVLNCHLRCSEYVMYRWTGIFSSSIVFPEIKPS